MKTKFAKTFTTWFFPVDEGYLQAFRDWVTYLRQEELFGLNDALFPKPKMGLQDGSFAALGLSRDTYSNAGTLRALSFDDVKHYQRILKILSETDRIMATITMTLDGTDS